MLFNPAEERTARPPPWITGLVFPSKRSHTEVYELLRGKRRRPPTLATSSAIAAAAWSIPMFFPLLLAESRLV